MSWAAPTISLLIDGAEQDFSALLLRDMCECPSCVHESSRQRLFSTAEIPSNIQARSIEQTAESVAITWIRDAPGFDHTHTTILSIDALRNLGSIGAVYGPFQSALDSSVTWGRDDEPARDVRFEDYMYDDTALNYAIKHLHTHGLLFVTDVPHKEEALVDIATRIGPMKDTFYGRTWDGMQAKCRSASPIHIHRAYVLTCASTHSAIRNQRRIYLLRSRVPHRSVVLPKSPSYPAPPLHTIVFDRGRQCFCRRFQIGSGADAG